LLHVSSPRTADSYSEDTKWGLKANEEEEEDITHGSCCLYTLRIKNIYKKRGFLDRDKKVKCTVLQALRGVQV